MSGNVALFQSRVQISHSSGVKGSFWSHIGSVKAFPTLVASAFTLVCVNFPTLDPNERRGATFITSTKGGIPLVVQLKWASRLSDQATLKR